MNNNGSVDTQDSIMPNPEQYRVLCLLAKEWDHSGPPGIMDISDIVAAVAQAPSETMRSLKTLFQNGLVDMNELKISAFLTPEGYAIAEQAPEKYRNA